MKRAKRHKIKQETPETSTSRFKEQEEHDLAYYIHDRVELMHQVFSVIKPKELKAMAPHCVYHISVDDLQELCTEELLGISSKRLCAILDGAEPPTDTESSSSEHNLETISLDSISSDDEVLSQHSSKKRHKHKKHKSKSRHRRKSSKSDKGEQEAGAEQDQSKASRAGLTVLELLELQARARAIRAQLQQDNAKATPADPRQESKPKADTSEDEVEIKEEPAEVVEISSEDEKPNIEDLPVKPPSTSKDNQPQGSSKTVSKRVNGLIVTVPQSKTRKIVLNRIKSVRSTSNSTEVSKTNDSSNNNDSAKTKTTDTSNDKATSNKNIAAKIVAPDKNKSKQKKKQKKKHKKSDKEEDHDEITLQLSDSEKMDLLEDLDRKNYESFTSSSEDSESSSNSDSEDSQSDKIASKNKNTSTVDKTCINDKINSETNIFKNVDKQKESIGTVLDSTENDKVASKNKDDGTPIVVDGLNKTTNNNRETNIVNNIEVGQKESNTLENDLRRVKECDGNAKEINNTTDAIQSVSTDDTEAKSTDTNISVNEQNLEDGDNKSPETTNKADNETNLETVVDVNNLKSHQAIKSVIVQLRNDELSVLNSTSKYTPIIITDGNKEPSENKQKEEVNTNTIETNDTGSVEEGEITRDRDLSDGEIADHEGEALSNNPQNSDVVCVSDDEQRSKKKKKKDKKKKNKKSKKSKSDFREGADQNFYREDSINNKQLEEKEIEETIVIDIQEENTQTDEIVSLDDDDDDDIYEILDISDDSSCYEFEGITVSKEPTAAEIEALSAKIDEIHANDVIVINDERDNDERQSENETENISWRDRYLGSKKVKRVLTTSNILNALRKKNKELKKKLENSKEKIQEVAEGDKRVSEEISGFVEGSIEHFNTLQGSSKYVDPVVESPEDKEAEDKNSEGKESEAGIKEVTKEMEKDAKQLLKMYKRLLKYNDINKKKDPNKKKKKKQKKNKEKDASKEK